MTSPSPPSRGFPARFLGLLISLSLATGGGLAAQPLTQPAGRGHAPPAVRIDTLAVRPALELRSDEGWTIAGLAAGSVALVPLDLRIAELARGAELQTSRPVGAGAALFSFVGLPGSLVAALILYVVGEATERPQLAEMGLHTGQAIVAADAIALAGKVVVGRARPHESPDDPIDLRFGRGLRGDRFQSFPSAHTASAFAAAAALSAELGDRQSTAQVWAAPLLYGMATLAGVSRIYHDEHWASDVAAGAMIGTFSGWKVVEWQRRRSPE